KIILRGVTLNKLIMLGTGAPMPDPKRNQSSQLLQTDKESILIDCGAGATRQLIKAKIKPQEVETVFITHLHADHIVDYGNFLISGWAAGRKNFTLVGPTGIKEFHERTLEMYKQDLEYRLGLGRS